MSDTVDGLHGEPNSTRTILYRNRYDGEGLLVGMEAIEERKMGEWTERKVFHEAESSTAIDEWQTARCSKCGKYHTTPYFYYFTDYDYCPHCGADMRGGETDV